MSLAPCPTCGYLVDAGSSCPRCANFDQATRPDVTDEPAPEPPAAEPEAIDEHDPRAVFARARREQDPERDARRARRAAFGDRYQDSARIRRLAPPIALGCGVLAKLLVFPSMLLIFVSAWVHEFGHAFVAWLSSRAATPISCGPASWTSTKRDASAIVYVCFAFLWGVFGYRGWRARAWFLVALCAVIAILQQVLTFGVSELTYRKLISFGGMGGEFYLSALLVIAFHYRFPDRIRWDFLRFVFLGIGAFTYVDAMGLWIQINRGKREIPYGTGMHGKTDAGGDMNRLRYEHNWWPDKIKRIYTRLGIACGAVMLANYLIFFFKRDPQPEAQEAS